MRGPNGFTLIEVLISLALLTIAAIPILWICAAAHRLSRSQAEAGDLQQRARVAAEKLQRDLAMAGTGPPDGAEIRLVDLLGPIIPACTGFRLADPELSAFSDRISILYVPADGWACPLSSAMPAASADVPIDPAARGCGAAGLCGFLEGSRALVVDTRARGAGFELFTVSGIAGALAHGAPNARVLAGLCATFRPGHADRSADLLFRPPRAPAHGLRRPLERHAAPRQRRRSPVSYFADAVPGPGLRPLPLAELADGPPIGLPPNRFDADARSIRLIRVTIRLQAAADDVRGAGSSFAAPGRSTSGYTLVPDFEVTFDVTPRNMRASP